LRKYGEHIVVCIFHDDALIIKLNKININITRGNGRNLAVHAKNANFATL
jgi:hypothetical protein